MRTEIIAVASFGDDPEKVEVILPIGDVNQMLAEVNTQANFSLFGLSVSYKYPLGVYETIPKQPGNTLVEITVPYCFHVPDHRLLEMKHKSKTVFLAFKKIWTERAEGSSSADYRSPTRTLFHNNTSVQSPSFPSEPQLGPYPICKGVNIEAAKDALLSKLASNWAVERGERPAVKG